MMVKDHRKMNSTKSLLTGYVLIKGITGKRTKWAKERYGRAEREREKESKNKRENKEGSEQAGRCEQKAERNVEESRRSTDSWKKRVLALELTGDRKRGQGQERERAW